MRSALNNRAFVCLDCRLHHFQQVRRRFQSNLIEAQHTRATIDLSTGLPFDISKNIQKSPARSQPKSQPKANGTSSNTTRPLKKSLPITEDTQAATTTSDNAVVNDEAPLSLPEEVCVTAILHLRQKLQAWEDKLATDVDLDKHSETVATGVLFEDAVKATAGIANPRGLGKDVLESLGKAYAGQQLSNFMKDTDHVVAQRPGERRQILHKLGIGERELEGASKDGVSSQKERRLSRKSPLQTATTRKMSKVVDKKSPRKVFNLVIRPIGSRLADKKSSSTVPDLRSRAVQTVSTTKISAPNPVPAEDPEFEKLAPGLGETKRPIPKLNSTQIQRLRGSDVEMEPLEMDVPTVPSLSFDLSRVLFNPGIYQLQDPRSRVFNFSPYLQRVLPVSEFNYDALNEYITSSKDEGLRQLGLTHQKKYLGSSSSMTGILTHFHFLLSAWRTINVKTLSQSFTSPLRSFTQFQRGPSAVFLRWKDGIYAVDADKEHDSANILMILGKSMEKLLTLEEEDFERYRKSAQKEGVPPPTTQPEAYHYTESGDFLLRSQLDAHDSRLPGTGMFDLKTRAVMPIRMNLRDHESVLGYEIQNRFGDVESYEREYFDMIRSAFLKYSLQVRMGRMDGIFVAYHNIERIFGFQYISQPEMDFHLHGTENRAIGDTEFKLSLGLLNDIFNRVTTKMPETSVRFHIETRDSAGAEGSYMYIFAEAQSEEEIEEIQNSRKAEFAETEARIFNPPEERGEPLDREEVPLPAVSEDFNSAKFSQPAANKLLAFTLRILNKVNGEPALRPIDLDANDSWDIEYTLEEMSHDRALATYNQCRGRRTKLHHSTRLDGAADYYLRQMKAMAENGRSIRKTIDQRDAGKPIVVLDR